MSNNQVFYSELQLRKHGKVFKTFHVVHNLPEFGIQIQFALDSWLARTKSYKMKAFFHYVRKKISSPDLILMSKELYDQIVARTQQQTKH